MLASYVRQSLLLTVGFSPLVANATRADDRVYTVLRVESILSRLELQWDREVVSPSPSLWYMDVRRSSEPVGSDLEFALHPSVELARRALEEVRWSISWPPRHNAPSDLGDARYVYGGGDAGTLLFTRRNAFVTFRWRDDEQRGLEIARAIDALIRDDRRIAPLGRFDPPPEIVSVGIPETLPVGLRVATVPGRFRDVPEESRYRFTPEFRGLGDPNALRVIVSGGARNQTTLDGRSQPRIEVTVPTPFPPPLNFSVGSRERTPEEDGRFMLELPLKPGPAKLRMVVVTPDNVMVTKDFEVTFTPR